MEISSAPCDEPTGPCVADEAGVASCITQLAGGADEFSSACSDLSRLCMDPNMAPITVNQELAVSSGAVLTSHQCIDSF